MNEKLEILIKKYSIDFNSNSISVCNKMSIDELLNAYKHNNLQTFQSLEVRPNFEETFKMGFLSHFMSDKGFIEQSYELAQFSFKWIDKLNLVVSQTHIANMILENTDKKVKCFLFEKYLLSDTIVWKDREFERLFTNVMTHPNWYFNLDLFSLNQDFESKLKMSSPNALNRLLQLSSKRDLVKKIEVLIKDKNIQWTDDIDNIKPSFAKMIKMNKQFYKDNIDEDKAIEVLKLLSILPEVNKIPNIFDIFQEQIDLIPFLPTGKEKAIKFLASLEKTLLSQQIEVPQLQNKKNMKI